MRTKVEPKLKFEVGEEVIICGAHSYSFSSSPEYYPNTDEFTVTTIKEVNEDGSVVVDEGYKFRQAYKTEYGETYAFEYFRINRAQKYIKFNNKKYWKDGGLFARIDDNCIFYYGPVYLYKKSKVFEDKMSKWPDEYACYLQEKKMAEDAKMAKELKEKPFKDAYNEVVKPLKEEYERKLVEAWKEHFCKSCKHNCNGNCTQWNQDIATANTETCSAWEVR